jgi:hypothetical protein
MPKLRPATSTSPGAPRGAKSGRGFPGNAARCPRCPAACTRPAPARRCRRRRRDARPVPCGGGYSCQHLARIGDAPAQRRGGHGVGRGPDTPACLGRPHAALEVARRAGDHGLALRRSCRRSPRRRRRRWAGPRRRRRQDLHRALAPRPGRGPAGWPVRPRLHAGGTGARAAPARQSAGRRAWRRCRRRCRPRRCACRRARPPHAVLAGLCGAASWGPAWPHRSRVARRLPGSDAQPASSSPGKGDAGLASQACVTSSGAISPVCAPSSALMLHRVMRSCIDSARAPRRP